MIGSKSETQSRHNYMVMFGHT